MSKKVTVTLSGPQGSGKTQLATVIKTEFDRLKTEGKLPADLRLELVEFQTRQETE